MCQAIPVVISSCLHRKRSNFSRRAGVLYQCESLGLWPEQIGGTGIFFIMSKSSSRESRNYWLFKTEADCFSVDDLARAKHQTTFWDGVRNYQARNMLRDDVQIGDQVLLYHSNCDPLLIAGTCEVVKAGYPDHTAFDKGQQHFDPKSRPDAPTWYMVDIKLLKKFPQPVTRDQLKAEPALTEMMVLRKGSRLSIQPVTEAEWKVVLQLADRNQHEAEEA